MRVWELIAPAVLAITAAAFSAHVGSAQTPDLQCTQLPDLPDDGPPLAVETNRSGAARVTMSNGAERRSGQSDFYVPAGQGAFPGEQTTGGNKILSRCRRSRPCRRDE